MGNVSIVGRLIGFRGYIDTAASQPSSMDCCIFNYHKPELYILPSGLGLSLPGPMGREAVVAEEETTLTPAGEHWRLFTARAPPRGH